MHSHNLAIGYLTKQTNKDNRSINFQETPVLDEPFTYFF